MRTKILMAALPAAFLLSACAGPDYGYYDANGNYIPAANAVTDQHRRHAPSPGQPGMPAYDSSNVIVVPAPIEYPVTYTRRGYYDYYGNFVTVDSRLVIPSDMYPPRGMCRVWLPQRSPESQPPIQSCEGIQWRVPAGGYVVYGG